MLFWYFLGKVIYTTVRLVQFLILQGYDRRVYHRLIIPFWSPSCHSRWITDIRLVTLSWYFAGSSFQCLSMFSTRSPWVGPISCHLRGSGCKLQILQRETAWNPSARKCSTLSMYLFFPLSHHRSFSLTPTYFVPISQKTRCSVQSELLGDQQHIFYLASLESPVSEVMRQLVVSQTQCLHARSLNTTNHIRSEEFQRLRNSLLMNFSLKLQFLHSVTLI